MSHSRISYRAFNEIMLDAQYKIEQNLDNFRALFVYEENAETENTARVLMTANDGNDYVILEAEGRFFFLALTNRIDGYGDWIACEEHKDYFEALEAMCNMSTIDNNC